ncbi:MAG: hypothetical protein DMG41_05960 [Acidobacteria bacterium]|nr:MAG: hypothetical protein DMG41_05960 [Acidobacteriota bacterium]
MAGELGRPLTESEQQALLKRRGNPLVLAGRYRQDYRTLAFGRQLIGPVLFPFYVRVLSFNLGLTFAVIAIIFIALGVSGQKVGVNDVLSSCLLQLFIQLGAVTLIFSLIERHLTKNPDRWDLSGTCGGLRLDLKNGKNSSLPIERGQGYRSAALSLPDPRSRGEFFEARSHLVSGVFPDRVAHGCRNRAGDH